MLRHAMDDVMSSLEDMGMSRTEPEPEPKAPFNPWSPEAFDELHKPSARRPDPRPLTSLGLGAGGSNYSDQEGYSSHHNLPDQYDDGPPQLGNYVQRMESRLRQMQDQNGQYQDPGDGHPPEPPPKNSPFHSRPTSAMGGRRPSIKNRKSAYELGRAALGRTFTIKSSATNSSSGVQSNATLSSAQTSMASQSIMSGHSAGGFSATSAGSLARRNKFSNIDAGRPVTSTGTRGYEFRPQTPLTSTTFAPSRHARQGAQSAVGWENTSSFGESVGGLGGFSTPKAKKTGFFKKLIEGAKTGAASARSNIAVGQSSMPPPKATFNNGAPGIAGGTGFSRPGQGRDAAREMGLADSNSDWLKMRQDVNRSNTPGPTERQERADRCLMLDHPVICPVDELFETAEGNEGTDGLPVPDPFQINNPGLNLVDKAARFITSLPPMTNAASLAQGYVCRPHRSDVQRLRAIFTWVSERVAWEEDFEGQIDTRRVVQSKRGCSHELAVLVVEMCQAINIHAELVRGHLKTPGQDLDLDALNKPNHYWNAILVDNEWRMMDCSLASPTNPRRTLFSSISPSIAEPFYFLAKPLELCYTHVPLDDAQQHIVPPISPDVLLSLPCALPSYFRQSLSLHAYDTSLIRLDALEMCIISVNVPADVELVAEVETNSFLRDPDGDVYENSDAVTRKRALAQASWYTPPSNPHILQKRYIVKALLPGDEGIGILKVYAGKKGLMHSSKDIPHPLAMVLPLYHQGENPAYEFLVRHPTPHAMRQDLYVLQPQCKRLCVGETYIFAVRQHAASVVTTPSVVQNGFDGRPVSPNPNMRPTSAMSMTSSAAGNGSGSEQGSGTGQALTVKAKDKPAKLAVQSPGGKILRLNRKADGTTQTSSGRESDGQVQGSVWETIVKVQERGIWRGLVLADRSARWCVWGEWECP
jgi:Transglutaminase-like superfamily